MKTSKFFAALVMGLTVVACSNNAEPAAEGEEGAVAAQETVKTAQDFVSSKAMVDSVSYLVGINFGSFIKGYNFGDLNYAQIKKGIEDFVKAEGSPRDPDFGEQFKINPEKMNDLFNEYLENRQNFIKYSNKEKGEKYMADYAKKDGVQKTATGLLYRVFDAGSDVKPAAQDTVWAKYTGKTIDGKVFDETKEGEDAREFTLNRVIPGWTEGLQYIGEGGKIELVIPSILGYGEYGNQGIEPNSVLVFNIEITKVGKYVEPAPAVEE